MDAYSQAFPNNIKMMLNHASILDRGKEPGSAEEASHLIRRAFQLTPPGYAPVNSLLRGMPPASCTSQGSTELAAGADDQCAYLCSNTAHSDVRAVLATPNVRASTY